MGLIQREREFDRHLLLVDAGDFCQGTPYFNYYKGRIEVDAMNRMGYDAVALGNHEFDYGVDTLALDRKISNIEGTYYPSSADCMARIVPTSLEDKGRGRLSKETVTIDSLVNNIANFEGEIVDIAVAKTTRLAEGVYTMTTTDGVAIAVRGEVVPSDAKMTGLIYHTSAEQGQAFTVTA